MVRKLGIVFLFPMIIILLFPFSFTYAEGSVSSNDYSFTFPASLVEIGDEAFDGTAARTLNFQNKLEKIGDRAFYHVIALKDVYVPSSLKSVGSQVFHRNALLRIHGVIGSRIQTWANANNVTFVPLNKTHHVVVKNRWGITHGNLIVRYSQIIRSKRVLKLCDRNVDQGKSMRPQERIELNPIDYKFP